jgi:hypothetical protein
MFGYDLVIQEVKKFWSAKERACYDKIFNFSQKETRPQPGGISAALERKARSSRCQSSAWA